MRKNFYLILFAFGCTGVFAQTPAVESQAWEFNPDVSFYFLPDDFFVLPVFRADKTDYTWKLVIIMKIGRHFPGGWDTIFPEEKNSNMLLRP